MKIEPAIQVTALRKVFRRTVALEGLTLEVSPGSTLFLLGPNGSGKTTLIRIISGVLRPTSGTVRVLELDPFHHLERLSQDLGIAYENHSIPPWATAQDFLRFAARIRGFDDTEVEEAAKTFEVEAYWDREIGTYSAGMRRRVILAQSWLGNPRLLLLDEPHASLDPQGRLLLAELLNKRRAEGLTTVVATHLVETAALPTHLGCLLNGQLESIGLIGDLADQFGALVSTIYVSDPIEAVRLLLRKGIKSVTATGDHLLIRGNRSLVETTMEVLRAAGVDANILEESYDTWAIYGLVLAGHHLTEVPASSSDTP